MRLGNLGSQWGPNDKVARKKRITWGTDNKALCYRTSNHDVRSQTLKKQ